MSPFSPRQEGIAAESQERLMDAIVESNPSQKNFLRKSRETLGQSDAQLCRVYLKYCEDSGVTLEYLAGAYNFFVRETVKEQMFFARHGRYRYSRYAEVAERVYLDEDYMRKYMHGLALTAFLWPNHRAMGRFFESGLPRRPAGRYLEVGPGHGFQMLRAMVTTSFETYEGIDISPASVDLTQSILSRMAPSGKRFVVRLADFLSLDGSERVDALVMGEVLEHVETPVDFLAKIREISHAGTHIYLSTCVNAPEVDHITLFSSLDQLRQLVAAAGLGIRDELALPHAGVSLDEARAGRLPINVAFHLEIQ
jgi:2-polyprenyl-3-methyl-5-hydroxy-6-metoxy-1,4-benzoquinol methylase